LETRSNGVGNLLGIRKAPDRDAPVFRFSWRFPGCCMFLKIYISVFAHFLFEPPSFGHAHDSDGLGFSRVFGLVRDYCFFSRFLSVLFHVFLDSRAPPPRLGLFFLVHDRESVIFFKTNSRFFRFPVRTRHSCFFPRFNQCCCRFIKIRLFVQQGRVGGVNDSKCSLTSIHYNAKLTYKYSLQRNAFLISLNRQL
jgi:hypothetical protein